MAIGVFVGVLAPDLAQLARPLLEPTVFAMLAVSIMRLDPSRFRRPGEFGVVGPALLWILIAGPLLVAGVVSILGVPAVLALSIVTWSACPPLVSVAAIASIMRIDPAPALLAMIAATFLFPFTLPPLLLSLMGLEIEISVLDLTLRLALFVTGAGITAYLLRRVLGKARLDRHASLLDGLFVLMMLTFAVSIMGDVRQEILERPSRVLGFTAAAFAVSLSMQAVALVLFAWAGRARSTSIALASGNRNMAIIMAAAAGAYGAEGFLFLAVLQFPIYLLPMLTAPLYRRWLDGARDVA